MKNHKAAFFFSILCASLLLCAGAAGCASKSVPAETKKEPKKTAEPLAADDLAVVLDDFETMAGFAAAKNAAWKKTLAEIIPSTILKKFQRARFVKLSDLSPADEADVLTPAFYSVKKRPSAAGITKLLTERKNLIFITNSPIGEEDDREEWSEAAKQFAQTGTAYAAAIAALLPFEGLYKTASNLSVQDAETFMKKDVFFKKFSRGGASDFKVVSSVNGILTVADYFGAAAIKIYLLSLDGRLSGAADELAKRAREAADFPYGQNFLKFPLWPIDPLADKMDFDFQAGYLNPATFGAAGLEELGRKSDDGVWTLAAAAIDSRKELYAGGKLVLPKTKSIFYSCEWDLTLKPETGAENGEVKKLEEYFKTKKQRSRIVEGALMQLAEFPKLDWKTIAQPVKLNYYAICKTAAAKSEQPADSSNITWSRWEGKDASNAPVWRNESSWAPYQLSQGDALAEELIKAFSAGGSGSIEMKLPASIVLTGMKK